MKWWINIKNPAVFLRFLALNRSVVASHQQVLIEAIRAIVTITIIVTIVYHHDHNCHHHDHHDLDHHDLDHHDLLLNIMIIINVEQKAVAGID